MNVKNMRWQSERTGKSCKRVFTLYKVQRLIALVLYNGIYSHNINLHRDSSSFSVSISYFLFVQRR